MRNAKRFSPQELAAIKARVEKSYRTENMSEIARAIEINVTTLHNYFSGRSVLPMRVLETLAERGGTSVDYLLSGNTITGFKAEVITLLDGTDAEDNEQTRAVIRNVLAALPKKHPQPKPKEP